jgi:hypothetical protein
MKNLYKIILEEIKEKPQMYTGDKTLVSLRQFINGFQFATSIYQMESLNPSFSDFSQWLGEKYKTGLSLSYYTIIIKECKNNEEKALALFFELLEEFLENYNNNDI